MNKKTVVFLFLGLIILCGQVFAQSLPQKWNVTDEDVKAVATNFKKIEEDFKKYDIDPTVINTTGYEKVAKDLEDTFQKYGVTGPNPIQKTSVIFSGALYEKTAIKLDKEMTAANLAFMKVMGVDPYDSLQQIKKDIHPDDMMVISRNSKLFDKVFDK